MLPRNGATRHPKSTPIYVRGRSRPIGFVAGGVFDDETGTVYTACIDDIWTHGLPVLRGYGDQIGLTLNRWTVNGQPPAAKWESNQAVKDAQLGLFEGMAR